MGRSLTCMSRAGGTPRLLADSSTRPWPTAVVAPGEMVTDRAAANLGVMEHRLPEAWHRTERYANNRI